MIARRFIDTDILLYSISRDPDETRKRKPGPILCRTISRPG